MNVANLSRELFDRQLPWFINLYPTGYCASGATSRELADERASETRVAVIEVRADRTVDITWTDGAA